MNKPKDERQKTRLEDSFQRAFAVDLASFGHLCRQVCVSLQRLAELLNGYNDNDNDAE